MIVISESTYYLILKKRSGGYEILYNIGSESNIMTVLRLKGKNAGKIFNEIVGTLAKQGAAIPSSVSEYEQIYSVRDDLGPVVGAYLILIRRARNLEKWSRFFRLLLDGHYVGVAKSFSDFLEIAIELSKSLPESGSSRRKYTLSPIVVDALSSALKQFVDRIIKSYKIN